jgi:RNA polymerase sigma-70 factor (ECF subfamily)
VLHRGHGGHRIQRPGLNQDPDQVSDGELLAATRSQPDAFAASGWVTQLLERLPAEQREAVRARILDERSYPDIAGELQTSELVIRKRVSCGLSNLRAELEKPS